MPDIRWMKSLLRYLVLILWMGFRGHPVIAQSQSKNYVDSLLHIAHKSRQDSNSVNALIHVQRYFFERGLYDSTLKYAILALPIAQATGDKKSLMRMNYNLGMTYTNLTRYDSAKHYLTQALALMPLAKDTVLEINCYNAFANLANYQSDYSLAIEYLVKVAAIIDKSKSAKVKQWLPQTYGNIGHNLIAEKQLEKGIEYEKKALLIKNYPNEQRYRVLLHLDVFDAYRQLKQLVLAKPYLDSAIALNHTINNITVSSIVANNEGIYYEDLKDYERALAAYLESYNLCEQTQNDYLKAEVGDNIAHLYLLKGKYAEAANHAQEANEIGRRLKQYKVAAGSYEKLKAISTKKGDLKTALTFSELYKIYNDSATNEQTQKLTLSLESKYQHQKKERELAALTIANAQSELRVVRRNRLLVSGGIAATAAIVILGLLYRNTRQKQLLAEQEQKYQHEKIKFLEQQQQVVSLQSMVNGQETERTRIAKDLHDGLGGLFSTVKMYFSKIQHDTPLLREDELFQKSYKLVDTASEEVRRIAHNMMPEVLMKLGLTNAVQDLCDNISAGKLLSVALEVHGMEMRLNAIT
jgi:signal transduction histidine kinase